MPSGVGLALGPLHAGRTRRLAGTIDHRTMRRDFMVRRLFLERNKASNGTSVVSALPRTATGDGANLAE
jgi:hypothetical protein